MISVEEARKKVLDPIRPLSSERVDLLDALDRVLASDVRSDIDIAPFDNSAMDGYAVRVQDVVDASQDTPVELDVVEHVAAGAVPTHVVGHGQATRIMTGAPMPAGADSVVMVEVTEGRSKDGMPGGVIAILKGVKRGENVRRRAEDVQKGQIVLNAGETVGRAAIGLLASCGASSVEVFGRPRVAIVTTGDELVDIDEKPGPGQIRNSNMWALSAQISTAGGIPVTLGVARDTEEETRALLEGAGGFDAMVTTVVRSVLESLGDMSFWKVCMRPGAPLTYGEIDGTPFFGLPGNPTSSYVSFELFVRPALRIMQGRRDLDRPEVIATLTHDVKKKPDRRYFMRGRLERGSPTGYVVTLAGSQSSALMSTMHRANCLVTLPEGETQFPTGTPVTCIRLDMEEGTP